MKKLIFLSLMSLCAFTVSAQNYSSPGIPSGTNSTTPTFRIKPATPDSLAQIWLGIGGNKFYRMSTGMDVLVADANVFKGAGTTSSKFSLADTIKGGRFFSVGHDNFLVQSGTTGAYHTFTQTTDTSYTAELSGVIYKAALGIGKVQTTLGVLRVLDGKTAGILTDSTGLTQFTSDINGKAPQLHIQYDQSDPLSLITRHTVDSLVSSGGSGTVITGNGISGDGSSGTPVILGGSLNQNTTIVAGATNIFTINSISGLNSASVQLQGGILQNFVSRSGHGSAFSTYSVSGSDPVSQIGYEDNAGTGFKTISFGIVNKGAYLLDSKTSLGILFASDYSTNQRANLNSAASVKTVKLLIDSATATGVTSVFGRTGAVVAATNDYTFAQIGSKPTTLSGYGITDAYPLSGNPSSFLTANQSITLSGDVIGSGTTAITATLANTAVTPGSYTAANITVDGKGRITAAANGSGGFSNPMTTTGDIIYSSSGSTPARLAIGGANTVLHGGTTPSYSAIVNGDITNSTIDLTTKVTGILPNANTTATSAATASTIVSRDANVNTTVNNLIDGYATTATAAGTTTLTVGSNYQQYFTGSTTQTVTLPVVSTLVLGQQYSITNLSSGTVTINSSGANIVQAMTQNTIAIFTCIATTGTTATSWNVQYSSLTPGGTIAQNIQINNIQTTPTDALTLQNTTLSTSGVKLQYSPNLIFGGHAWNTGGAADTYNNFRIYQQMAGQFGYLNFDYSNSTTSTPSYTNVLQLDGNSRIAGVNGTLSASIVKSLGTAQVGGINSANQGSNQTLKLQNQNNFSTSGTFIQAINTGVNHSSGTFINFDINDKFTETSTAGDIDFTINRNEVSLGSGAHQFASWMVGGVEKFGMLNTGQFTLPVILKNYTVSTLPTGVQGMTAYVTDALTPASLATVVGGGSSIVPVFYNGTNWIVQ